MCAASLSNLPQPHAPLSVTTMFPTLPAALQLLIAPLLLLRPNADDGIPMPRQMGFQLRHQHGVTNDSRVVFMDVASSLVESRYIVNAKMISTHRPTSHAAYNRAWSRAMRAMQSEADLWTNTMTPAPNVEDRETLLMLAKMTSNAYFKQDDSEWYDLPSPWSNHVSARYNTSDACDKVHDV